MEPIIKDILLHLKQNMFFFEMDSVRTLIEKGILIGLPDNNKLMS